MLSSVPQTKNKTKTILEQMGEYLRRWSLLLPPTIKKRNISLQQGGELEKKFGLVDGKSSDSQTSNRHVFLAHKDERCKQCCTYAIPQRNA